MAPWGTRSKAARDPSRGQTNSSAAAWQPAEAGRSAINQDAIARRAYEKFLSRGGRHGDDQRDWFEAEQELAAESRKN